MATTKRRCDMLLLGTVVCSLFLCFLVRLVGGEETYFHRDHSDQGIYRSRSHTKFAGVHTYADLVHYLNKYGYLNCTYSRRQRREVEDFTPQFEEMDEVDKIRASSSHKKVCQDDEIVAATKKLQLKLGLVPTGELDEATKQMLNHPRCGNKDVKCPVDVRTADDGNSTETTACNATDLTTDETHRDLITDETHRDKRSLLEKIIVGRNNGAASTASASVRRRKRMLDEIMERIRNENETERNMIIPRRKRSTPVDDANGDPLRKFQLVDGQPITWRLLQAGYSQRFPVIEQQGMLELAFRMWSEVAPMRFKRQDSGDIDDIDVQIAFGKGHHLNCKRDFDGSGGEIAHSRTGYDMHFDDDENYKIRDYDMDGIYFVRVAVHEIGHVLGLTHNDKADSIMYPIYQTSAGAELELGTNDRRALQQIYGVCRGTFDIVFDWLRKKPGSTSDYPRYIFNTYFFRDNHYWMYENRANRTRFGDPLYIANEWKGLPNDIDGYTQILFRIGVYEYDIQTYFFKNDKYYLYDDDEDIVKDGWPRLIADDFGPQANCTETVPNNLDAVYYDRRDKLLYFFKGEWVWAYDPKLIGTGECCESKVLFTDLFPMAPGSNETITGNIAEVFYSYAHHKLYMFDGETVYENIGYASHENWLRKTSAWYQKWYDICDVFCQ